LDSRLLKNDELMLRETAAMFQMFHLGEPASSWACGALFQDLQVGHSPPVGEDASAASSGFERGMFQVH
jgi:hypothetical protein